MDFLIYNIPAIPPDAVDWELLPADERETALKRGGHYALIRTLLRRELARRTGNKGRDIVFTYSEHGKPEYAGQPFNLSHSGDCLCLAFHQSAIGVDVERIRPRRFESLASRFMCPEQAAAFASRGCPQDEFYACWCAAEALVKQAGDTMWHALRYPFLYYPGRIRCLFDHAPLVHLFTPLPGYSGAVAYHPVPVPHHASSTTPYSD